MSEEAHSYLEAASEEIVRALRPYGVLTKDRLADEVGADHMPHFVPALAKAIDEGRVRELTPELYELTDQEKIFSRSQ